MRRGAVGNVKGQSKLFIAAVGRPPRATGSAAGGREDDGGDLRHCGPPRNGGIIKNRFPYRRQIDVRLIWLALFLRPFVYPPTFVPSFSSVVSTHVPFRSSQRFLSLIPTRGEMMISELAFLAEVPSQTCSHIRNQSHSCRRCCRRPRCSRRTLSSTACWWARSMAVPLLMLVFQRPSGRGFSPFFMGSHQRRQQTWN